MCSGARKRGRRLASWATPEYVKASVPLPKPGSRAPLESNVAFTLVSTQERRCAMEVLFSLVAPTSGYGSRQYLGSCAVSGSRRMLSRGGPDAPARTGRREPPRQKANAQRFKNLRSENDGRPLRRWGEEAFCLRLLEDDQPPSIALYERNPAAIVLCAGPVDRDLQPIDVSGFTANRSA